MAKKKDPKGKFVVAYDTLFDGWNCMMESGEDGVEHPCLFDSEDEAFREIFDGNLSKLQANESDGVLEEFNGGVTPELIREMEKVFDAGDVTEMRKFMDENPECDDSGEWVESTETFLMNRKAFLTQEGGFITGTKI